MDSQGLVTCSGQAAVQVVYLCLEILDPVHCRLWFCMHQSNLVCTLTLTEKELLQIDLMVGFRGLRPWEATGSVSRELEWQGQILNIQGNWIIGKKEEMSQDGLREKVIAMRKDVSRIVVLSAATFHSMAQGSRA